MTKKVSKPPNILYCTKCGRIMKKKLIGAEILSEYSTSPYIPTDLIIKIRTINHGKSLGNFDSKTGKKQFVWEYQCPKNHWWNNHDSQIDIRIITEGEV